MNTVKNTADTKHINIASGNEKNYRIAMKKKKHRGKQIAEQQVMMFKKITKRDLTGKNKIGGTNMLNLIRRNYTKSPAGKSKTQNKQCGESEASEKGISFHKRSCQWVNPALD